MKKEIVFLTAQKSTWPLINALYKSNKNLISLIPYYNKTFKNDSDFLPIKLELSDLNNFKNQADIASYLENQISSNKSIPQIILADQWSANVLKNYHLALDFNKTQLKDNLFHKAIVDLLNPNLDFGFYNLPFNVADINALRFNLDNLYLFFKLLKAGGAQIDFQNDLYIKSKNSFNPNKKSIKNNILNFVKPISSDIYKNISIKKNFFRITEELILISNQFVQGLTLIEEKLHLLNDSINDLNIFVFDYPEKNLIKMFLSKFEVKNHWYDKENRNKLVNLLKNIKQNFSFVIKNDKYSKQICSVKFLKSYENEWGNYDLLQYKSIFGIVTGVGLRYAVDSYFTRKYFANKSTNTEKISNFTNYKNVETFNQIIFETKGTKKCTYLLGGSSIIASVSSDMQTNKAIIKFLTWLYTGEIKINDVKISTHEFINKHSGYFIPFNTFVTQNNIKYQENKCSNLLAKIQKYEQNKGILNTNEIFKNIDWTFYLKYFNLKTVLTSIKTLFNVDAISKKTLFKTTFIQSGNDNLYEHTIANLIYDFLVTENINNELLVKIKNL